VEDFNNPEIDRLNTEIAEMKKKEQKDLEQFDLDKNEFEQMINSMKEKELIDVQKLVEHEDRIQQYTAEASQ